MEYSTVLEEVQIPAGMKEVEPQSLYERLQGVKDGRGNRNHWRCDVTLGEDACRVAVGHAPLFSPHSIMPSWLSLIFSTGLIWPRPSAFLMPILTQHLRFFSPTRLLKCRSYSHSTFAQPCSVPTAR